MREFVEKIVLEIHNNVWVARSLRGCGILVKATVGKHDEDYRETRSTALAFAYQVVHAIGLPPAYERTPIPQLLLDAADTVIDDPEHVDLICTTWQYQPGGIEICSIGTNSVLVFEGDTLRRAIAPHNINELLRSQGSQIHEPVKRRNPYKDSGV